MDIDAFPRIRDLKPSPMINPLVDGKDIMISRRYVRSRVSNDYPAAGNAAVIHTVEERDEAEFVKVFAAGVAASYGLSKTGHRLFIIVLAVYQNTPMTGGFVDSVELFLFDEKLNGLDIGMSATTFNRGMRELLGKMFIYPRTSVSYWINPNLFFKGNRVLFIKEYVRARSNAIDAKPPQKRLLQP